MAYFSRSREAKEIEFSGTGVIPQHVALNFRSSWSLESNGEITYF